MPVFPAHLADDALAHGLRLSPFAWSEGLPDRDAASGTAVIGAPEALVAFGKRFTAAVPGDTVRSLAVTPDRHTVESVLYFPHYHLEGG